MSTTEIPEHLKDVEFVKPSESPTHDEGKARRLANRKKQLVSAVARGYAPPEALDKFNDEMRRMQESEDRRERDKENEDLEYERIRNAQREESTRARAQARVDAEDGGA